jgi:hypothetical protein
MIPEENDVLSNHLDDCQRSPSPRSPCEQLPGTEGIGPGSGFAQQSPKSISWTVRSESRDHLGDYSVIPFLTG